MALGLALPDDHERVGHDRRLPLFEGELLPGLHLPREGEQLPPERGRQTYQRNVQAGDRRRVAQELFLGLLPLASPRELLASVKRVGKPGGPPVVGSRALVSVGLAPPAHPESPQPIQPVAGGALWQLQHHADLLRRRHAMLREHGRDPPVRCRELIERHSSTDGTHLPCPLTFFRAA